MCVCIKAFDMLFYIYKTHHINSLLESLDHDELLICLVLELQLKCFTNVVIEICSNMGEWCYLSNSDLDSSVNKQLERLAAQMREAHLATQEAAKATSSDLKSLETRKVEIGDAIDASNSALLDAKDKIEKAKEMIKRANLLLSKAEPVRLEEITRLEQLKAQNDEVL